MEVLNFTTFPPLRVGEDYRNLGSIKTGIFVGGHPRNVLLTHLAPDKKNITTTTPNNPKIPTNDLQFKKRKKPNSNFDGVQSDTIFWCPTSQTLIKWGPKRSDDHHPENRRWPRPGWHQPSSPNLPMWKMKKKCSYNRNGAVGTFDTCFFHVEPDAKTFNHISKSGVWGFQQFNGEPISRVPPFLTLNLSCRLPPIRIQRRNFNNLLQSDLLVSTKNSITKVHRFSMHFAMEHNYFLLTIFLFCCCPVLVYLLFHFFWCDYWCFE